MATPVRAVDEATDWRGLLGDVARLVAVLLVVLVLQTAIAPNIRILGANPDFVLIAVVSVALLRGAEVGAIFGFAAGGLVSIVLFEPAGITALTLTLVGYLSGRFAETADLSSAMAPVFTVFVATIFGETMYALAQFLLGREAPAWYLTTHVVAPVVVLDTLLAAPVYLVARWFMGGERHARSQETR
jgi:rod shape-determining protein MreD